MKWMRFFVLSALICLMLAACGSDKPSQKQMKTDLEQTGRFSYQIEDVTVLSERGDREDYHANVKISGSDSLMDISEGGELQYRKSGGKTTAVMIDKPVSFGVQQRRKFFRAFRHWNRWRTICPAHARNPIAPVFTKIRIA